MDEETRRRTMAEFLQKERIKLSFKEGKMISQSEISRRIGVAQGSWSQWEQGTRVPDDKNAHRLAAAFGIRVYEILDMPISVPKNKELMTIVTDWSDLTKDQQKKFANMIRDEAEAQRERLQLPKAAVGETR